MPVATSEVVVRVLVAFACGGVLGLERELSGHAAGLRTHVLVSVGACIFTLAGFLFPVEAAADGSSAVRLDVTRVASQVVVGIGFLGGGTIIRHGATVRGLTTAANLWVAAALGLSAGLGLVRLAAFGGTLVLFTLVVLQPVERWISRRRRRQGLPPAHE